MARRRQSSGGRPRWRRVAFLVALCVAAAWSPATAATPPAGAPAIVEASGPPQRGRVERRSTRGESYLLYVPAAASARSPVFVDVHGISRNFDDHAQRLAPYAERYGVILVSPCFPKQEHSGYQWLGLEGRGRRADHALEVVLAEVGSLTGADTRHIYVFGFSGGAQFAHRFTMAYPERVNGAVIASAGWFTFPDSATPYPYGIGASQERSDLRFVPDRFLRVPMTVLVGGDDTGSQSLRSNPELDRQQGAVRRERARRWVEAMRDAAIARGLPPRVTFEEVPGIHHSFDQFMIEGDLGDRVFEALFGPQDATAPASRAAGSSDE